ncbi:trypsin-1 [Galendromus occidentalis]|uniref:Trypsin-1 n=1 Tax=Galendromus occidentalis TaxID=34638 RepID=A0AAJ7PAM7_9ACAR|nr:trypsin-1 [Galendromus occidentalis]
MRVFVAIAALFVHDATCVIQCGRSNNRSGKIVGGEKAREGDFPWQVQLRRHGTQICGGSILSENFAVTAAHCVQNNPSIYSVGYGSLRKYEKAEAVPVKSIHIHPGWKPNQGLSNDIAILKFGEPITLDNRKAAPICLPPKAYSPSGNLKVSGWGRTREGGRTSPELRYVVVPIIEDSQCSTRYGPVFNNASMFCAMYPAGGRDSCQGDSGGPAVVNHDGVHYLSGVVSWGEGCARYGAPGVYTRVNEFTPWVEEVVAENGAPSDLEQIRSTLNEETLEKIKSSKVKEPYLTTTTLVGLIPDIQSQLPSNPIPFPDSILGVAAQVSNAVG